MHHPEEASEDAHPKETDGINSTSTNDNLTDTPEAADPVIPPDVVFSVYAASTLADIPEEVRAILGKADLFADRAREYRRRAARELRSAFCLLEEAERVEAITNNAYHEALALSTSEPSNDLSRRSAGIYISGRQMECRESRRRELVQCDQLARQQRKQIVDLLQETEPEA